MRGGDDMGERRKGKGREGKEEKGGGRGSVVMQEERKRRRRKIEGR